MLLLAFNSACRFRLLVSVPLHGRSTFLFKHEAYTARTGEVECNFCTVWFALSMPKRIGLITVSDAILTGRQSGQKLQCLYGNPMAKNFFQNRILHKL